MKITLKNNDLIPVIDFLKNMPIKGKDSRHRSKLVKQLQAALDGLIEAEKELISEFGLLDENNELIPAEKQDTEAVKEFQKEQKVLYDEEVVIEGGVFAKNFDEMPRILNEYEGELSGAQAEIYDRLLDEMEKEADEK